MTEGFTIEIKGIAELQTKFKQLDSEIQSILSTAVTQGGLVVERAAKENVHVITGNLRRSIREIQKVETTSRVESQVGSDVSYAEEEEFRVGGQYPGSHAYLRPAIDENEANIQAAIESAISKALGKYR